MSRWCGKCDFRDALSIHFDDNFDYFMQRTKGIIYQRQGKEVIEITITQPADLIPYYPHIIGVMESCPQGAYIRISEHSYLDTRIREIGEFNEKYPDWKHSTVYYEMQKAKLAALYEKEKAKPIKEQGIVDD